MQCYVVRKSVGDLYAEKCDWNGVDTALAAEPSGT